MRYWLFAHINMKKTENSYPSGFPDTCRDCNHRGQGYNDSKLPVKLNRPKNNSVNLEQVEWIQSLKTKTIYQ